MTFSAASDDGFLTDRSFHIVLLGPPGSGKGTQGKRLAADLGLAYLSTGALLREAVENETGFGKKISPILTRGEYLPDHLMFPLLEEWLQNHSGWVLDGFPRSIPQAVFLTNWLVCAGLKLDAAIYLQASFDELLPRIFQRVECPKCRWSGQSSHIYEAGICPVCSSLVGVRYDDQEANFRRRFQEFEAQTRPVVGYYSSQSVLISCHAARPLAVVSAEVDDAIIHLKAQMHA